MLVGGIAADRFPLARVLRLVETANLLTAGTVAVLALADGLRMGHLAAAAFVFGAGLGFFYPAYSASLPRILPARQLLAANGVEGTARPLLQQAAGPAVAGLLIGLVAPGGAVAAEPQQAALVGQTPQDFLEFRQRLAPASGFQSVQFRTIEIRLGLAARERLNIDGKPFEARLSESDRASRTTRTWVLTRTGTGVRLKADDGEWKFSLRVTPAEVKRPLEGTGGTVENASATNATLTLDGSGTNAFGGTVQNGLTDTPASVRIAESCAFELAWVRPPLPRRPMRAWRNGATRGGTRRPILHAPIFSGRRAGREPEPDPDEAAELAELAERVGHATLAVHDDRGWHRVPFENLGESFYSVVAHYEVVFITPRFVVDARMARVLVEVVGDVEAGLHGVRHAVRHVGPAAPVEPPERPAAVHRADTDRQPPRTGTAAP